MVQTGIWQNHPRKNAKRRCHGVRDFVVLQREIFGFQTMDLWLMSSRKKKQENPRLLFPDFSTQKPAVPCLDIVFCAKLKLSQLVNSKLTLKTSRASLLQTASNYD